MLRTLVLVSMLLILSSHTSQARLRIIPLDTYESGIFDESAAEIVAPDPFRQRLFVVNADAENAATKDLGPEGVKFIPAEKSPINEPLLAVGKEVSGTTTVYRIRP